MKCNKQTKQTKGKQHKRCSSFATSYTVTFPLFSFFHTTNSVENNNCIHLLKLLFLTFLQAKNNNNNRKLFHFMIVCGIKIDIHCLHFMLLNVNAIKKTLHLIQTTHIHMHLHSHVYNIQTPKATSNPRLAQQ